ncbi:MAG: DUF1294 domain-containing protein [Lachnospiraceae bacterium]
MWSIYFCIINVLTFLVYGADKRRAKSGKYRISERFLLLLALIGGAGGAWLGMYFFRHKTKHSKFVIGVPVIILIYLGLFLYWKLYSPFSS